MAIYIKLFEVLFPVFLVIGIGYWYGKKDPKFDTKFITTLAGNIGLPCIIFYSLTTSNVDLSVFLRFFLIFLLIGNASTKPAKAPYTVVFSDEDAIEHTESQPNTDA